MKVLYIIKQDIDATGQALIAQHQEHAEVSVVDIREHKNYDTLVEQVFRSDRVICW
ncbi:MAG: hypothetical protein RQ736_00840 [Thiogranum sp.]|nr:hypothetical protein [Thiogranum sp.]